MPRGSDGGKWALAGFLYQIVGMLSITARALAPADISSGDESEEVDALVALMGDGEEFQAHHEELGQDAVFTGDDDCVIAQFKYSSTARKIGRGELGEIVERLDHSAQQATSQGQNVTACVLVTNRQFTSRGGGAQQHWEVERGRQRNYELRYCLVSLGGLERKLRDFGAKYGLFDPEIEGGVDKLIGRVFRQTVEPFGASVGMQDIVESFVGYPEARALAVKDVGPLCDDKLREFGTLIRVDQWEGMPIRRGVFEDIARAVKERSLVSIYGHGGCGKSVVLWQLLTHLRKEGTGCFMIRCARELPRGWITDTVHGWRNLPAGRQPDESWEESIGRLQIANPSLSRPFIWLALDALDEGVTLVDRETHVREIVRWFWERDRECQVHGKRPSATLVVSCRHEEDLADRWLALPPDYPGEYVFAIEVGDFSTQEIEEAVRIKFPDLYPEFASAYGDPFGLQEVDYSPVPFADASPYRRSGPFDPGVRKALEHPLMWRALLGLEDTVQLDAIQGDSQALHCLARGFIKLFHRKLRLREPTFKGWRREDRLIQILRSIAAHTSDAAAYARDADWTGPACHSGRISEHEAITLYDEALSAGLVTEEAPLSWRWRHMIVYDYLGSGAQAG